MIFKKILYVLALILSAILIIMSVRQEFAGSPWLQIIATYLIALLSFSWLLYLLFKNTRADTYALGLLQLLFLGYLFIFLIWMVNILVRVLNIIPLLLNEEPWIGRLFPGPYMWLAGLAFIPAFFSLALSIYWEECKRGEKISGPEIDEE